MAFCSSPPTKLHFEDCAATPNQERGECLGVKDSFLFPIRIAPDHSSGGNEIGQVANRSPFSPPGFAARARIAPPPPGRTGSGRRARPRHPTPDFVLVQAAIVYGKFKTLFNVPAIMPSKLEVGWSDRIKPSLTRRLGLRHFQFRQAGFREGDGWPSTARAIVTAIDGPSPSIERNLRALVRNDSGPGQSQGRSHFCGSAVIWTARPRRPRSAGA